MFVELTETERSRHSARLDVMTDDRFAFAGVQAPGPLGNLRFRFRGARKLPYMFRPRGHQHFGPKRPGIFQVFLDSVKKSTIAQKDQTELLSQRKEFFSVVRTNYRFDWIRALALISSDL